ncbi:cobalt-zinc-cadmium efflux system membrane fusion protein [Algoriphagus iocasae]|uniref:Cobalt-zinc-cadmium efflux system membrane fusion protein n=1 Tax=Algoriphagus iocasae TaxID=1836499 RepID=A0A841MR11_9BACT|nr:efflux RND transporter periplasmic adaptor subunit [Algoriphagus iocasae]MBB6324985.1 cobalt-zinc-cadmium efflux system membrane fusion protein [Algoriphagus iocasae]
MEAIQSKIYSGLLILVGLVFLIRCSPKSEENSGAESMESIEVGSNQIGLTKEQFAAMDMKWGEMVLKTFSEEIKVQGQVKIPVEGMQDITPFFGGYVADLKLMEGQQIRKGEVLFYLESPEFVRLQQEYLETSSQLNFLKEEFERQKTLFGEKIASQKGYLKAESEYQSSLAKAESLKKQLGMIHVNADKLTPASIQTKVPVISPINGYVESVFTVPGAFLPSASKAATLISTEHMHIELSVFEKDAVNVTEGQHVAFTLPDMPGKTFDAKVYVVGKSISEQRLVPVHAHLIDESQEHSLVPGMYLEAKIKLEPQEGWSLPVSAVVAADGVDYVLVQSGSDEKGFYLDKVEVKLGRQNDDLVEIYPNPKLDENSIILVKGAFTML